MNMFLNNIIKIFDLSLNDLSYGEVIKNIGGAVRESTTIIITYTTLHSLNLSCMNKQLTEMFNMFDIIHPDGVGVYLASKIIYGKNGFLQRINGSDLYPLLINEGIKNDWSFYFFGDTNDTLSKIHVRFPKLNVVGTHEGYNYKNDDLILEINEKKADILVVGLGCPKQEEWIIQNKDLINSKVILAVGDGIKVFAGTKKRGSKAIRSLGLEWMIRLINNPGRLWRRYLIGIPLFLFRVVKYKIQS
jgi:N-acetylglucosaminyldiphosphoundecaprenol N-acetyl-beta-D-mannosaminyltransferase